MLDVNGWELIMLVVVGILVLGPERLPEYAGKLANLVRQVRNLATNARSQLKDQMGPEFEDVDWRQFDPRQYDPRRIVREALMDPSPLDPPSGNGDGTGDGGSGVNGSGPGTSSRGHDPSLPTPYDVDAT
jgi:sec-independent protein translocase protein TatB